MIEKFTSFLGGNVGSDNVAAKIIEFSKKIRDLNAELGKEKTKSMAFKRHLDLLEKEKKVWFTFFHCFHSIVFIFHCLQFIGF